MNIPRFLDLFKEGRFEDAFESVIMDNPLPASTGRVCQHPCDNRCRRQTLDDAVNMREVHRFIADSFLLSDRFDALFDRFIAAQAPAHGQEGRRRRAPDRQGSPRLLPRAARPRRHHLREEPRGRRHAALRHPRVPAAQARPRPRDRADPPHGREFRVQLAPSARDLAQRSRRALRRRLPLDRHVEGSRGSTSPAPS